MSKPHKYRVHDSEHISTPMELRDARTYAAYRVELHPSSVVRITHRGKTVESFAKGKTTMAHRKSRGPKKERSPAQKAATKRMLAANRAARATRGGSSTSTKRKKGKRAKKTKTHSGGLTLASLAKTVHSHKASQDRVNHRQTQINHTLRAVAVQTQTALVQLYKVRGLPAPTRVHVRQLGSGY